MRKGTKVYVEELGQVGIVQELVGGKVKTVEVQTPDGPKVVDVLERGYKVLTLVLGILQLILKFFGK
jgi:hypothetical protein